MSILESISAKRCSKCGDIKAINEFYKHSGKLDGYFNKCKQCTRNDVNNHRVENIEKIREYDRNRPNRLERNKKHNERVKHLMLNESEKYNQYMDSKKYWSKGNSIKRNAHNKVKRYLTNKGFKPSKCERCGIEDVEIQGHHDDYNKPLDVMWLCISCHGERHRELNEINRTKT